MDIHTLKLFDLSGDLYKELLFEFFSDALATFTAEVPRAQCYGAEIWTGKRLLVQFKAGGIS